MVGQDKSAQKTSKISKSTKADLQFPVARIGRYLRKGRYSENVRKNGQVYLTAVLQYLAAEILQFAGQVAISNNKNKIVPIDVQIEIRNDELLCKVQRANHQNKISQYKKVQSLFKHR